MAANHDPNGAERWKRLAADSRAVAETLTDPEAKTAMYQIAYGYMCLAAHAEERKTLVVAAIELPKDKPETV